MRTVRNMRILYLDTSSKYLSLAVAEDEKVLSQIHRPLDRKHSLQLVTLIDKVLKGAEISLREIDGFCVSKGPGSFTGLRIGITTIKGLAFVLGKPVVAIPTLDILAQNVKKATKLKHQDKLLQVCAIVDAKQNKVYACLYQLRNGTARPVWRYLLLPVSELLKKLKGKIIFLGDGVRVYRKEICASKKVKPVFTEEKLWYPQARQAVPLALERFHENELEDIDSLVPLYLYPKECQIKR